MVTFRLESPYGIGIYSLAEASRLTGVRRQRLRRWLCGRRYATEVGEARTSPALWARELPFDEGQLVLSFRDLIESRWISFFRDQGVGWAAIRKAGAHAAEELHVSHPFSTGRFAAVVERKKDRQRALIAENLPDRMRDVLTNQYMLRRVMAPFVRQLQFRDDRVLRWFPLEGSRRVVLDPSIRFGAPIVASGVPTEILWKNHRYGKASYRALSRWWGVPEQEVRDAVRWENELRAA